MSVFKRAFSKFTHFLRRNFFSGLLVWAPVIVTVAIVSFLIDAIDNVFLLLLPGAFKPDIFFGIHIPGFGVLISFIVLISTGFIAANFLGRFFIELWEKLWHKIPIIRSIYSSVKQVMETLLSPKGKAFRKVVLVEWPRKDMWSIAFVTTKTAIRVIPCDKNEYINIFIPATPNITSGFLMIVDKKQTKDLDLNVDEALKLVVSLGVVQPADLPVQSDIKLL